MQEFEGSADLPRFGMRGEAGEHLREHLLRLVGVAGFGEGAGGEQVVVDELRVRRVVFGKLAGDGKHGRVVLLPCGELRQREYLLGGQLGGVDAFEFSGRMSSKLGWWPCAAAVMRRCNSAYCGARA